MTKQEFIERARNDFTNMNKNCNAALANINGTVIATSGMIAKLSGRGEVEVKRIYSEAVTEAKAKKALYDAHDDQWFLNNNQRDTFTSFNG